MGSLAFEYILQIMIPSLSLGLVLAGFLIFFNTVTLLPERKYISIFLLTLISMLYIILDLFSLYYLLLFQDIQRAAEFGIIKEVLTLFYLPILPFFIHEFIFISPIINRITKSLMILLSIYVLSVIIMFAFNPSLYITYDISTFTQGSFTSLIQYNPQILQKITETLHALMLLFILTLIIIHLFKNSITDDFILLFLGCLLGDYFFLGAIIKTLTGSYIPPFKDLIYSRMSVGLAIFTIFFYLGVFRLFIRQSRETEEARRNLKHEKKRLLNMAFTDTITQIGNRAAFMKDIKVFLENKDFQGALLIMDINDFSLVNESYGPSMGDQILHILANRFKQNLPDFVQTYRTGSNEFSFILTCIHHSEEAKEISILIQNWLLQGVSIDGEEYRIQASIGFSLIPGQGQELHNILTNTYRAMNQAKKRKIPIQAFQPHHQAEAEERISMIKQLRNSIQNQDFYLAYQPIFDIEKQLIGFEVLLRWKQKEGKTIPSALFIYSAEQAGIMQDLGDLIIQLFIQDFKTLGSMGKTMLFSMNLSVSQFFSMAIDNNLTYQLNKHSVPLQNIQLEIPQELFFPSIQAHTESLRDIRKQGIRIAIDNFGSILNFDDFSELQVDSFKIDKKIIEGLPDNRHSTYLLDTIINLSRLLKVPVNATGIENETQLNYLKNAGCQLFQGYLFQKPVNITSLKEILKQN